MAICSLAAQWKTGYEQWLAESFSRGSEMEETKELTHSLLIASSIVITATGAVAIGKGSGMATAAGLDGTATGGGAGDATGDDAGGGASTAEASTAPG